MQNKPSDSDLEKKIQELRKECDRLEMERMKLEIICRENDLLEDVSTISDTEAICATQLRRLRDLSNSADLTESQAKILDILHKNLRMAKSEVTNKDNSRKTKKMSNVDLLRLVGVDE